MEEKNELSVQPRDYGAEILEIIHASLGDDELRAALLEYHENDIAGVFEELEAEDRERLYGILGSEVMSDIVTYLDDASKFRGLDRSSISVNADFVSQKTTADIDISFSLRGKHILEILFATALKYVTQKTKK